MRGRRAIPAPAGHLYVYFTYGMHFCANVVTGEDGLASAVLLRAGAVVDGHELAATRRPGVRERDWARGPARLTVTMGLAREENGLDLCGTARTGPGAGGRMLPPSAPVDPATIRTGPRVGVSGPGVLERDPYAVAPADLDRIAVLGTWLDGEPTVSPYRPGVVRSRGQKRA